MLPELEELNRIRLKEDRTFTDLGNEIGIEGSALNRLLRDERAPMERTLYKIREYLTARKKKARVS